MFYLCMFFIYEAVGKVVRPPPFCKVYFCCIGLTDKIVLAKEAVSRPPIYNPSHAYLPLLN